MTTPPPTLSPAPKPPPHDMESRMAIVLTAGTTTALALALAGVAMFIFKGQKDPIDLHTFGQGVGTGYRGIRAVIKDALTGDPLGIMQVSALVLVATPVARVVFALIAFALKRDWLYTIVALIVLAGLALGLTGLVE